MAVKAVAFDIDGTMYPNYKMFLKSIPFFIKNAHIVMAFNEMRKDIRKRQPIEDFQQAQAEIFAEKMNIEVLEAKKIITSKMYAEWETIFTRMGLYPGFKESIISLKDQGYKLGVLSDFPPEKKLTYFGLEGLWDIVLGSEETGYLKPAEVPFLRLCELLGEEPSSVLYVGNNYSYDVVGASKLGMKTAHITSKIRKDSLADIQFNNYKKLPGLIAAL